MSPDRPTPEHAPEPACIAPDSSPPTLVGSIARRSDATGLEVVGLLLIASMLSLWGLRSGPGLSDHEAIVAVGARGMIQSGNWLVPTVGREEFLRKPPLPFWLAAISSRLIDDAVADPVVSVAAARLPSALAGALTVLVVLFLARSMYGHRTGMVTGGVLASSAGLLYYAHNAQVEMVLTLFSTCAVASFWFATQPNARRHRWWALFYLSLGLAMLAKAPLPAVTVVLPLAIWWFVTIPLAAGSTVDVGATSANPTSRPGTFLSQLRRVRQLWIFPGILVFALVFAPIPIYIYLTRPGALDLWRIEFLDRYAGELRVTDHPPYYYIPIAFGLVFPWSLSLPEAIASAFLPRNRQHRTALLFAFTWVAVQLVFLSTSAFKRPHYLVGTLPGMALLLGPVIERFFLRVREVPRRSLWLSGLGLLALLLGICILAWRELAKDMPPIVHTLRVALPVFCIGTAASFITFALRHRATSLLALIGTVAATFTCAWDTMDGHEGMDRRAVVLMQEIRETAIAPGDRFTWVAGRPDARFMYYLNLDISPLFTALELAPKRTGRQDIPTWLATEALGEIRKRLGSNEKEYFVVQGRYWDALQTELADTATVICRATAEPAHPKYDWILFTQSWNTAWKRPER